MAVSLVLVLIACGSTNDDASWDVGEVDQPPDPITHGIYEAEFEIVEDGCKPSLETIFGKEENWPPPEVGVFVTDQESVDYDRAQVTAFSWRDGGFWPISTRLFGTYIPESTTLGTEDWPSLTGFVHVSCPYRLSESQYYTRVQVQQLSATTIELVFESSWGDLDECVDERAWEEFATIPTEPCQEKYIVRYHLKEACDMACEIEPNSLGGGRTDAGYPYVRYREPLRCVCDD
jgi:hypothetical protein